MTDPHQTRTGGRGPTTGHIAGDCVISVGMPEAETPPAWRWKPLTDLARLETGHTPSRRHPEYWDGDIPWIGIRDATGNHGRTLRDTEQHVTQAGIDNSSARLLPTNTVCLSRTASVGYVVVMGRPMATSQDFVSWVCNPDLLDFRYLKYALLAERTSYSRFAHGTTHQTIYFPEVKAFHICAPSKSTQTTIADVLSALDDKIEQNQRTARALERLARAIFRAWFVDFEPVKAKAAGATSFPSMSQPVFDALPTRFVDSEIGPVPEGWDVSNIGTCSSYLSRGITPRYIQEGGVLVVNQKCIRDFMIDFTKARRHDRELKKIDGREIAVGDVLINSTGVGTLGRVAQVLNLPEPAVADSHVTVVRPSPTLSWAFLGQALMLKQPVIEAMGEGSTGQTELSRKKLSELLLAVPPNSVLSAFDETVVPLMRLISTTLKESKKLAQLRDLLLPKLLSGQVRVGADVTRPEVST